MTAATQILKTRLGDDSARRFQLSDLSEPFVLSPKATRFEPLLIVESRSPDGETEATPSPRLESAIAALQTAVHQLRAHFDNCLNQCQQDAVHIGVAIAERLLRRTLVVEPEAIIELIQSALESSDRSEHLRVRLHSADAKLITKAAGALNTNHEIEFLPDDTLARGDCIIESPNGQIDARRNVILQRITEELLDAS